jgi:hypothetical protein
MTGVVLWIVRARAAISRDETADIIIAPAPDTARMISSITSSKNAKNGERTHAALRRTGFADLSLTLFGGYFGLIVEM